MNKLIRIQKQIILQFLWTSRYCYKYEQVVDSLQREKKQEKEMVQKADVNKKDDDDESHPKFSHQVRIKGAYSHTTRRYLQHKNYNQTSVRVQRRL